MTTTAPQPRIGAVHQRRHSRNVPDVSESQVPPEILAFVLRVRDEAAACQQREQMAAAARVQAQIDHGAGERAVLEQRVRELVSLTGRLRQVADIFHGGLASGDDGSGRRPVLRVIRGGGHPTIIAFSPAGLADILRPFRNPRRVLQVLGPVAVAGLAAFVVVSMVGGKTGPQISPSGYSSAAPAGQLGGALPMPLPGRGDAWRPVTPGWIPPLRPTVPGSPSSPVAAKARSSRSAAASATPTTSPTPVITAGGQGYPQPPTTHKASPTPTPTPSDSPSDTPSDTPSPDPS